MKDKFVVIEANTPVGNMLLTDVTYDYTKKIAECYEKLSYEPPVTEAVRELPYTHFLDVGAGYGYYSLLAAARPEVKGVIAFEPHPIRFGLLWWNTQGKEKIASHMQFVSSDVAIDRIAFTDNPSGLFGKHVGGRIPIEPRENVATTTLDNTYRFLKLLTDEPMQILTKIDVEGFELEVLKGASYLFQPNNYFLVETHKSVISDQEILDYMGANGFGKYKELIGNQKNGIYLFEYSE